MSRVGTGTVAIYNFMDISTGHLTNCDVELLDDETLPFDISKYKYGWIVSTTNMMWADIRLGEQVAKDMIAVPVGSEMRMVVVGAPSYFTRCPKPTKPQDFLSHNCINLRLPTYGGLNAWEFEKNGRELKVRVDGQLVSNSSGSIMDAAMAGLGVAYLPEEQARSCIREGQLVQLLSKWCPLF